MPGLTTLLLLVELAAPCPVTVARNPYSEPPSTLLVSSQQVLLSIPSVNVQVACEGRIIRVVAPGGKRARTLELRLDEAGDALTYSPPVLAPLPDGLQARRDELLGLVDWTTWVAGVLRPAEGKTVRLPADAGVASMTRLAQTLKAESDALEAQLRAAERTAEEASRPFTLSNPRRLGRLGEEDVSDVYWNEQRLCVAQGQGADRVRCYDPATARWGRDENRKPPRKEDGSQRIVVGGPTPGTLALDGCKLSSAQHTWPLSLLGVKLDALEEPLLVKQRAAAQARRAAQEELDCDHCPGSFCTSETELQCRTLSSPDGDEEVELGCPRALLVDGKRRFAAAIIPITVTTTTCWANGYRCADLSRPANDALWLFDLAVKK